MGKKEKKKKNIKDKSLVQLDSLQPVENSVVMTLYFAAAVQQ